MLKKLCYFVCLCLIISDVSAVPNCPTTEGTTEQNCIAVLGCWWDQVGGCTYCTEDQYYDANTKTCKPCPDSHPKAEAGSTIGISACYTTCENQSITGGQRVATSDKAYYNNTCTYTTTCNTTSNATCSNRGFHLVGDTCVSDVDTTTCGGNKYKFFVSDSWSDCYVSSCGDGETLIPKALCGTKNYGECKPSGISCSSAQSAGLDTTKCSGTIDGTATLSGATYDFSSCTCKKGQQVNITNGTAIETCHFSNDGKSLSTNCSHELQTCNSGYCDQGNNQTCVSVPADYYSVGTEKECHKCPNGATSNTGSTSKTACHYTSATIFTDSGGSFTLPANGNVTIQWIK